MSKQLEDFVNNNRDDFDKFEPGPVVWHNIRQQLEKPVAKEGILISMKLLRRLAAAAIIVALGTGMYAYFTRQATVPVIVKAGRQPTTHTLPVITLPPPANEIPVDRQDAGKDQSGIAGDAQQVKDNDQPYNEELYHYARLVELKQNEIKKIKRDEPVLYHQFAGDFNKLDSTFHILKKQLPVNPNREQILEAMIQNLQYQEALLNQQLNIIKKINNTKKEAYEKAYRSV